MVVRIRMGTDDPEDIDKITFNTIGIVHLLAVLAVAAIGGLFAVATEGARRAAIRSTLPRPVFERRPVGAAIILLGLSLAGLGTLDRPSSADFLPYFP